MADLEIRVRSKAEQLWKDAGRPAGGPGAYRDRASELIAIEDNTDQTLESNPVGETPPPDDAEPLGPVENLGEQLHLTDQGESRDYPLPRGDRTGRRSRSAAQERKGAKP